MLVSRHFGVPAAVSVHFRFSTGIDVTFLRPRARRVSGFVELDIHESGP